MIEAVTKSFQNWKRELAQHPGKPVPFRRPPWTGYSVLHIHPDWNRDSKTAGRYQLQVFLRVGGPHIKASLITRAHYTSSLEVVEDWRTTCSFLEIEGLWADASDEATEAGIVLDEKKRVTQIVNGEKLPKRDHIVVMER